MRGPVKQTAIQLYEALTARPPWSEYAPYGRRIMWMGIFLIFLATLLLATIFGTIITLDLPNREVHELINQVISGEEFWGTINILTRGLALAVEYVIIALLLVALLASTFFVRRINWGDKVQMNPLFPSLSPPWASGAKLLICLLLAGGLIRFFAYEASDPLEMVLLSLFAALIVGIGLLTLGGIMSSVADLAGQTIQRRTPDSLNDPLLDGVNRSELAVDDGSLIIKKEATRVVVATDEVSALTVRGIVFGLDRDRLLIGIPIAAVLGGAFGYFIGNEEWVVVLILGFILLMICISYLYTASLETKQIEIRTKTGPVYQFVTREDWEEIDNTTAKLVE